jgi:hypothetical protein
MTKAKNDFYKATPMTTTCDKRYELACIYIKELESEKYKMVDYLLGLVEITGPDKKFISETAKAIHRTTKSFVERIMNEPFDNIKNIQGE